MEDIPRAGLGWGVAGGPLRHQKGRRENGSVLLISGEAGALRISLHWCKAVEGPETAGTSGHTSENLSLPPKGWCEQVGGGIQKTINKNRDLEILTFRKITPYIAEQMKSSKKWGKSFLNNYGVMP